MSTTDQPLTVGELMDALAAFALQEPDFLDMNVSFGMDCTPVCGGTIHQSTAGDRHLNLAPIQLDKVGGF